jgi:hypothetical protein
MPIDVDAISTDSITLALVVIPTQFATKPPFLNSILRHEISTGLGDQGSQVRVLSPRLCRLWEAAAFNRGDLLVLAMWGVCGAVIAFRFFSWEPHP